MAIEMIEVEEFNQGTQIKVIGVGGGGGNAVEHMIERGRAGRASSSAPTPTRRRSIAQRAHKTDPARHHRPGRRQQAREGPRRGRGRRSTTSAQAIDGAHMLFITAGMGGGTGTGAAPVIARVAKEMGILTVGVVTKPFDFEGGRRMTNADAGLAELEANVDSLIVDAQREAARRARRRRHAGRGLRARQRRAEERRRRHHAKSSTMPGLVNVDFEDVRTVMGEPGKAMMGTAVGQRPGPRAHRRRAGRGLPAARRHRPVGRQAACWC